MAAIALELDALQKQLVKMGHQAKRQPETQQLCVPIVVDQIEYPLFIRLMESGSLLQMVTFFPETFEPEATSDLARLLHVINRELDLPGLGMDEGSHTFFYRLIIHGTQGTVNAALLSEHLKAMEHVCSLFSEPLLAVAGGKVRFDEILKRLTAPQK